MKQCLQRLWENVGCKGRSMRGYGLVKGGDMEGCGAMWGEWEGLYTHTVHETSV